MKEESLLVVGYEYFRGRMPYNQPNLVINIPNFIPIVHSFKRK